MAGRQFWVVVYDIPDDRRRGRLHTTLLDFGTPVQYSVFECWLTADELEALKKRVARLIRPRKDHVRWYYLCARCSERAGASGSREVTRPKEVIVA